MLKATRQAWPRVVTVRYADDLIVLCRSEAEAEASHRWLVDALGRLKLAVHPDKTRVVGVADGRAGFDFLGFHFRRAPMVRRPGRRATKTWPSQRAQESLRAKIKAATAPRSRLHLPVEEIVAELNPLLRGWGAYFRRPGNGRQMSQIDHYVRLRVALFVSKKRRRRGSLPGRCAVIRAGGRGSACTTCLGHLSPRDCECPRSRDRRRAG